MKNGSVTPREEGFAKQTQFMLLGGWSADDIASRLEASLVEKMPQIYSLISYGPDARGRNRYCISNR